MNKHFMYLQQKSYASNTLISRKTMESECISEFIYFTTKQDVDNWRDRNYYKSSDIILNLSSEIRKYLLNMEHCLLYGSRGINNNQDKYFFKSDKNYLHNTTKKSKDTKVSTPQQGSFRNLLVYEDKDKLMKALHKLFVQKRGKEVAAIIKALEKLRCIRSYGTKANLHRLLQQEFGNNIGGVRNITNYLLNKPNYILRAEDIEEKENDLKLFME